MLHLVLVLEQILEILKLPSHTRGDSSAVKMLMLTLSFCLSPCSSHTWTHHLSLSPANPPPAVCECVLPSWPFALWTLDLSTCEWLYFWFPLWAGGGRLLSSQIGYQQDKAQRIKLALSSFSPSAFTLSTSGNTHKYLLLFAHRSLSLTLRFLIIFICLHTYTHFIWTRTYINEYATCGKHTCSNSQWISISG